MAGGGCERVIAHLANRWNAEGVDVTVLTEYRHESVFRLDAGVKLVSLSEKTFMGEKDIPKVYLSLRELVKKEKPDAVLALPEKVNVWTVLFLIGTGVPVIVSERNDPKRHPENKVKRALRRIVYPFAAGYIFQTSVQRDFFPESIRKSGAVLDNPLATDGLPESGRKRVKKTVVTAARLEPQKNLSVLIAAFSEFYKKHSEYELVIYGEGRERELLEKAADRAGVRKAVSLPGTKENIPQVIADAGMFVLSSDFEGMPNALIEAMAMGVPCVSTDCPAGGPASLIEDGVNGLLVPVNDPGKMAEAMCRIADDPVYAKNLGEKALNVRQRLDIAFTAQKWREYIDGCTK